MLRVLLHYRSVESIRKAIITAAGSGTRLLPFSKETPKEMLPCCARGVNNHLILKPILQIVYESIYDHGCREFCFVVGRGKRSIENYFLADDSARYSTNSDLQDFYKRVHSSHIMFAQQPAPLGFGDAVQQAKIFAKGDNFLLHAGDDVILSPGNGHIKRLEDAFFSFDADVAFLIDSVERPEQYGVIDGENIGKGLIRVEHLEEKPMRPKTNLAVIATYIFKPSIFDQLESTKPDINGEVQLTDAIKSLVANNKCIAVELEDGERRIDVGTPESYAMCIRESFENASKGSDGDSRA